MAEQPAKYTQQQMEDFAEHYARHRDDEWIKGRNVRDVMADFFAKKDQQQWKQVFDAAKVEKVLVVRGSQKQRLVQYLLDPKYYLIEGKRRGRSGYTLYIWPQIPVMWYSVAAMRFIRPVLRVKGKKYKKWLLNLSLVRQQHGKTIVKREYIRYRKELQP